LFRATIPHGATLDHWPALPADRVEVEHGVFVDPLDLQTVETVRWTSVPGKTDYVVVDGYAEAEGSYTIQVDCACQ